GASGGAPDNELDFIQMTGITRPEPVTEEPAAPPPAVDDSLSFYEPGVRDVDNAMTPQAIESRTEPARVVEEDAKPAADGFRSIADELVQRDQVDERPDTGTIATPVTGTEASAPMDAEAQAPADAEVPAPIVAEIPEVSVEPEEAPDNSEVPE